MLFIWNNKNFHFRPPLRPEGTRGAALMKERRVLFTYLLRLPSGAVALSSFELEEKQEHNQLCNSFSSHLAVCLAISATNQRKPLSNSR